MRLCNSIIVALALMPLTAALAAPPATNAPAVAATVATPQSTAGFAAQAEVAPSVPAMDESHLARRDALDYQIEILERQAKIADLRKKIAGDSAPVALPSMASALVSAPTFPAAGGAHTTPVSTAVVGQSGSSKSLRLVGVVEVGRAAQATIVDNGIPVKVRVGSDLPSGWRVVSITSTSATLARGRAHRHLSIGE